MSVLTMTSHCAAIALIVAGVWEIRGADLETTYLRQYLPHAEHCASCVGLAIARSMGAGLVLVFLGLGLLVTLAIERNTSTASVNTSSQLIALTAILQRLDILVANQAQERPSKDPEAQSHRTLVKIRRPNIPTRRPKSRVA